MLRIGIIGYGSRISHMAREMGIFGIPYHIAAVADPRAEQLAASGDALLAETCFYDSADAMLASETLDGVMVGTRCDLHTEMALKVAQRRLPLFLEKPVAISFEQLVALQQGFADYQPITVVSFPLRVTPIVQRVKAMLEADEIGTVEHMVAFNDVPYGRVYYNHWYRDYGITGGLWLQKATHDLDYLQYLIDDEPDTVAAMHARRVYGGDKPFDLRCIDCDEWETCPESPFNRFHAGFEGERVDLESTSMCLFSTGITNQDMGNCLVQYRGGAQLSYTQNFFARHLAARRGARLYGYRGTIEFDWYQNQIKVYRHRSPVAETIDFGGNMAHFGGDRELCLDFARGVRDGTPSRSPIQAGILSALTCLWARESALTGQFCRVEMPS
ncbi:MAG: Gfo/Idh/MocA family oxidoreductase [Chloroflexi bacterium]|nr:Gfo/Idh/MocA family oxidoreductase [Chloroflexota bacterium]